MQKQSNIKLKSLLTENVDLKSAIIKVAKQSDDGSKQVRGLRSGYYNIVDAINPIMEALNLLKSDGMTSNELDAEFKIWNDVANLVQKSKLGKIL